MIKSIVSLKSILIVKRNDLSFFLIYSEIIVNLHHLFQYTLTKLFAKTAVLKKRPIRHKRAPAFLSFPENPEFFV